jgi:mono/diheme cytochrome c family protein
MIDCSRMKTICRHLTVLGFLFSFTGCSSEKPPVAESTPSPVVTPGQSPSPSSTPDRGTVENSGGASSSGGTSGSGSTSAAEVEYSSYDRRSNPDNPEQKPEQEVALSPSDWRRQNFKPRAFSEFKELRGYIEVRSLSPQPASRTTVESGKKLYSQACIACHNLDGSPVRRDPALLKYNMANLSQPRQYLYGSSPKAMFRSIRYGVPSPPMGFTGSIYSRTEVWDIVNYIQSIQKR